MIIDGKPCLVACNIERNHAAPFEALDKSRSQQALFLVEVPQSA